MTKTLAKFFVITMLLCGKNLMAQVPTSFEEAHKQLLGDYILFIDSVEKKTSILQHEFDVRAHRHISKVVFSDDRYEYQIIKKVRVYASGIRYEKIDWKIRKLGAFWFHKKLYEIKQIGHNYRFIEKVDYHFGKKITPTKITASYDDNYLSIHELRTKEKKETVYFFVKPTSSVPLLHQD